MAHDPYEHYPQHRPMPHPGSRQSEPMKLANAPIDCLKAIEEHALALATIAAEPDAWKQYQLSVENREVVIDRHENQVRTYTHLLHRFLFENLRLVDWQTLGYTVDQYNTMFRIFWEE